MKAKQRSPVPNGSTRVDEPPNLVDFMTQGWRAQNRNASRPVPGSARHRARRDTLGRRFPEDILVIPAGHRKVRANDTLFRFRPASDFYYLTGIAEPDCILLLVHGREPLLFARDNAGRSDVSFFTDRRYGELWEGPRPSVRDLDTRHSIDCHPLEELEATLLKHLADHRARVRRVGGIAPEIDDLIDRHARHDASEEHELTEFLAEMRLTKDAAEIRAVRAAIASTHLGFEDIIARLKAGASERELECAFMSRARMDGNDAGYHPVIAAGAHASILHWQRNDGKVRKGDLILVDAGVEVESFYTADITRTLPVDGKFSAEQRAVYELVLEAQRAALKRVRPGESFSGPNAAAMDVLACGLQKLGILKSAEEALRPENQFHRRYSLHGVSHMLGLDVHDCSGARNALYRDGALSPGMVLTVEPGLYFQPNDLTVPPRFRGMGIRIEDDVLVTPQGHSVLSGRIPKETSDVEDWMRSVWSRRRRHS